MKSKEEKKILVIYGHLILNALNTKYGTWIEGRA